MMWYAIFPSFISPLHFTEPIFCFDHVQGGPRSRTSTRGKKVPALPKSECMARDAWQALRGNHGTTKTFSFLPGHVNLMMSMIGQSMESGETVLCAKLWGQGYLGFGRPRRSSGLLLCSSKYLSETPPQNYKWLTIVRNQKTDPRFISTLKQILKTPERGGLSTNSLVYRYDLAKAEDGVEGEEGTFCLCKRIGCKRNHTHTAYSCPSPGTLW